MAGRPPLQLQQRQVIDLEELDRREQGTYFAFYDSFWHVRPTQIPLSNVADALVGIRRERMPTMYEQAFSAENLDKNLARSENSSSEASNSSTARVETDLLGHRVFHKAHLISDAKVGSKSYGFIAEAALGLSNSSAETRLKLLNGVEHAVGENGRIERVRQSGLKHNKYNKLRLILQKEALDMDPYFLIVPILTLRQVLDWDETDPRRDYSYDVMICARSCTMAEALYGELFHKHRGPDSECTPQDIITATDLLSTFARAIATSTYNDGIMESMTPENIRNSRSVASIVDRIKQAKATATRSAEVDLPSINPAVVNLDNPTAMATHDVRVVKARVSKRTSLPDPYLVTVKAVANWFAAQGQRMLAAASVSDSEYSGSDSEDAGYNDNWSSPLADDPLVNLRNSMLSGSHVHVELFSAD